MFKKKIHSTTPGIDITAKAPKEILLYVFGYLEVDDVEHVCYVSKYWWTITRDPKFLHDLQEKLQSWDTNQKQSLWELSDHNKIATVDTGGKSWQTIRGKRGYSDGIHYIKFTIIQFGYIRLGLVSEGYDISSIKESGSCIGAEQGEKIASSLCYHCLRTLYHNSTSVGEAKETYVGNDVIVMELNLQKKLVNFYKNGNFMGVIEGLKASKYYPAASCAYNNGQNVSVIKIQACRSVK